jgi:hypothetical protein
MVSGFCSSVCPKAKGKDDVIPVHVMTAYGAGTGDWGGGVDVELRSFLTWQQVEVSSQLHVPAALRMARNPMTTAQR